VRRWLVAVLVGLVATAFLAGLMKQAWPDVRAAGWAAFAAPGAALGLVLLLLARKWLIAQAKRRVRDGLEPPR